MADFVAIDISSLEPEADRFGQHPHPREMLWYGGDRAAERTLFDSYRSGRLHHAQLVTGPEGIGKAVLAYRFVRFVLAHPDPAAPEVLNAQDLSVGADHPVTGKVARLSHPDLAVIRRGPTKDGKALRGEIIVDDVRNGLDVFRTTAAAGGWRFVIVDSADDLNREGQNALLKMLEEPPERSVFLLVSHRPGALLPTIRSRCRVLRLQPPDEAALRDGIGRLTGAEPDAIAEAAAAGQGSFRLTLARLDPATVAIRRAAEKIFGSDTGRSDVKTTMALLDKATGRSGDVAFEIILETIETRLAEEVRRKAAPGAPPALLAARAELWEKLRSSVRDVETYNLDRRPLLLSVISELAEIERRTQG